MKFIIFAIFCAGVECEPVWFITQPRGSEVEANFCDRYAFGRAVTMAGGYIPRVEMTVQPGSVYCEEAPR
jgi:hypothetical protein